jgi:hypothetical protein
MGRLILIIAVFMSLFAIYFAMDHYRDAYMILPVETSPTLKAAPFSDWREFVQSNNKFTVQLPVVPQNATETVSIPNSDKKRDYDMYVSEQLNGTIYLISLITYPKDFNTADESHLLHEIVDEMVKANPNNQLVEVKDETVQGQKAVGYTINNKEISVKGKAIAEGKVVYIISYMAKTPDFTQAEYEHFINSFKIGPAKVAPVTNGSTNPALIPIPKSPPPPVAPTFGPTGSTGTTGASVPSVKGVTGL